MNRKQFFLVLLALAIVGSAGMVSLKHDRQTWTAHEANVGDKILPDIPINDVAAIHVKGVIDFNLVYTNEIWRVRERDDYPADFARISDLLLKLRDLKVVQSDLIGPSQLPRLNLNAPGSRTNAGTLFEFKDRHGKVLASLLIGKKHDKPQDPSEPPGMHGFFDGCYVLLPSDPQNALVASDELAAAAPDPGAWLNKDFFKIEHIKLISLVSPNPDDSWEISREDDSSPWVLTDAKPGEVLDTTVVFRPGEILAFPSFVDVLPKTPVNLASQGLDKPIVVTVLTDDLAYTLKVGRRNPDGSRPMLVSVAGNIPTERVASPDEKPEDKARLDAEFQDRTTDLRKKLAKGQAMAPWIFEADDWIHMVIYRRSDLLVKAMVATGQAVDH